MNLSSRFGEKKVTKSRVKVTKSVTKSRKKVTKSKSLTLDLDTLTPTMTLDLDTLTLDLDTSENDLDTQLRHSDTPKVSLSNKQRAIVNFCSVPRTTKEILDRIGVSMHSKNRERYITSLVAAGYLQMTNPENPTASNQKYKKVTTK